MTVIFLQQDVQEAEQCVLYHLGTRRLDASLLFSVLIHLECSDDEDMRDFSREKYSHVMLAMIDNGQLGYNGEHIWRSSQ